MTIALNHRLPPEKATGRTYQVRQIVLFIASGITAAMANFLSRLVFSGFVAFPLAVTLAYLVGLGTAFALNRWLVFPHSRQPTHKQAIGFVITNLAFLPVVLLASLFLRHSLASLGLTQYPQEIAHLMAIALPTLFSYLIYKFRVFGGST
jgi:putative flippase GtrA